MIPLTDRNPSRSFPFVNLFLILINFSKRFLQSQMVVVCGVAGAIAHIFLNPGSKIPCVGASGSIYGYSCFCFSCGFLAGLLRSFEQECSPFQRRDELLRGCLLEWK